MIPLIRKMGRRFFICVADYARAMQDIILYWRYKEQRICSR